MLQKSNRGFLLHTQEREGLHFKELAEEIAVTLVGYFLLLLLRIYPKRSVISVISKQNEADFIR